MRRISITRPSLSATSPSVTLGPEDAGSWYPSEMVSEGALVADKYRVERLLGEGGMGHVYAAIHEQLGLRVAIKILSPTLCANEDAVRRFSREARASVRIQSEHVARVLDVGQLENGAPFMVMEFLSGNDL